MSVGLSVGGSPFGSARGSRPQCNFLMVAGFKSAFPWGSGSIMCTGLEGLFLRANIGYMGGGAGEGRHSPDEGARQGDGVAADCAVQEQHLALGLLRRLPHPVGATAGHGRA